MMRRSLISVLAFFAMSLAGPFVASGSAQIPPPDAAPSTPVDMVALMPFEPTREEAVLEAYVDGVIAAHRRAHDAPAVAVSVVRDGRILFAKAYGDADVEQGVAANGHDTLFRIGSVSKTFTWTAVMMLHERGLIDLDADVNVYLKDMSIPEAFGAPVTMNDLMAHRAGFEDTFAVFTYADDGEASLTDALKATMPKRVYAPGMRTSYSNWGSALAAKIVADVSGVSFNAFLEEEILKPLAMTHTTIAAPLMMRDDENKALAKGYGVKGGAFVRAPYMQIGPFAPAGAIASTANDMAQWMLLHLGRGAHDGVRLMRDDTHELMWMRAYGERAAGADLAHGFMAGNYRGVETFGHGGATNAFYTNMTLIPELGVGIFVSQNTTKDRTLVQDLPLLLVDRLLNRPATPAQNDPAFAASAASFAGTYLDNRRSFSRFEKLFAANAIVTVAPAQGGALTVTAMGKARHFAPLPGAADTFEDRDGARIVFGRNGKGNVTHLTNGSGVQSYERVGLSTNPGLLNLALIAALFFAVTTLLGAWRRQGRAVAQSPTGALLGLGAMGAALTMLVFAGMAVLVTLALANAGAEAMQNYPPVVVHGLRLAGLAIFTVAGAGFVSLWPAWRRSGWRIWRKLHHTAFALALGGLAVMLVLWNVIFAGTV